MAYTADTATEIDSYKGDPTLAIGSDSGLASAFASQSKPNILLDGISQGLEEFAKKREAKKLEFQKAFAEELKSTSDIAGILEKDTPEIMALQKDLYRYVQQNPQVLSADGAIKYEDAYAQFRAKEQTLARMIQKSKDDVAFKKTLEKQLFDSPDPVAQKQYDNWLNQSLKDRTAFIPQFNPSYDIANIAKTASGNYEKVGNEIITQALNADGTPSNVYDNKIQTTTFDRDKFVKDYKPEFQSYYISEFNQLEDAKKKALIDAVKLTEEGKKLKTDAELLQLAKDTYVDNRIIQNLPLDRTDSKIQENLDHKTQRELELATGKGAVSVATHATNRQTDIDNPLTNGKESDQDKADRIKYNIQLDIDKVVPSDSQSKKVVDKAESNAKINNLTGQLWDISIPMTSRSGAPTGKNESLIDISPSLKLTINRLLENPKHILMQVDSQGKRTYFASDDGVNVDATKYTTPTAIQEAMFDDKDMNKRYDIAYPEASDNKEKSQPSTPTKQKTKIDVNTPLNKYRIKSGLQPI